MVILYKTHQHRLSHVHTPHFNRETYLCQSERSGCKMARGEHFEHKKKGHPGPLPEEGKMVEQHAKQSLEDEEFIVVQEAFKNRREKTE